MKKVNQQQIEKIDAFLIKKEIVYTDLRQEFIDHICSGIEEQWEKDPNLSFDKAFHTEYKNFGIFGFSDILEKREVDLKRYYWKQIGLHILGWFKIPQIFFTILLGYGIFEILLTQYNLLFIQISVGIIGITAIFQSIRLKIIQRRKLKQNQPVLLIDNVITEATATSFVVYLPVLQNFFFAEQKDFNVLAGSIGALLLTLLFLMIYLVLYDFPKNKKLYFKRNYQYA